MLPNFVIVGAAKCGTTSIDQVLRRHPGIKLPLGIKETYYWVSPKEVLGNGVGYTEREIVTERAEYEGLFRQGPKDAAVTVAGEICNGYLYFHAQTIQNLKHGLGDAKIIIVLRNPVSRAYSGYLHLMRDGVINETFQQAIEREDERVRKGYWWAFHLYRIGLYYEAVAAYKKNFSNVMVCFFEDFIDDAEAFYQDIFKFIGVNTNDDLDLNAHANRTGLPKSPNLWRLIRRDSALKRIAKQLLPEHIQDVIRGRFQDNLVKPAMDTQMGRKLWGLYIEDVEKMSKLLDRDLVALWEFK